MNAIAVAQGLEAIFVCHRPKALVIDGALHDRNPFCGHGPLLL